MVIAAAALAQMGGNYDGHMDWNDGSTWVMVTVMIVVTVVVVCGIIWAIVFASRSSNRPGSGGAPVAPAGPSAKDLLDQRYARGEIETAEYEERRSKLG